MAFNEFQIEELKKIEGFGKAYEQGEKLGAKVMGDAALLMIPGAGTYKLARTGGKLTTAAMDFVKRMRKAYPKAKINKTPTSNQLANAKPMGSAPKPTTTSRVKAERKPIRAERVPVKAERKPVRAEQKPLKKETKVVKAPTPKPKATGTSAKKKTAAALATAGAVGATTAAMLANKKTTVGATPDKAKDQAAQKRVRPTRPKPPGSQKDSSTNLTQKKVRPSRPKPPGSQRKEKFLAEPKKNQPATPKAVPKKAPAKKPVDPQAQQYRPGRATEEPLRAFGGRYDPKTEVLRNVMRNGKKKTMVFRKKK